MCVEDQAPPPGPAPQNFAPPPTPLSLAQDSLKAQQETGQGYLDLNNQFLPQYAQTLTNIQQQQAPQLGQINLQQQQQFGPALVQLALDQVRQSDPTGFALRQQLGNTMATNLATNGGLTPEETRLAQQDIRAGQVARGGGTSLGDAFDEARFLGNQRFTRAQAQIGNAQGFLNGRAPQDSFGAINQAGKIAPVGTQDVNPFLYQAPGTANLMSGNLQAFGQQSQNINAMNNFRQGQHEFDVANTTNPFLTALGIGSSLAGTFAGSAFGTTGVGAVAKGAGAAGAACWVAEELYGKEATKTRRLRVYVKRHLGDRGSLGKFCRLYLQKGREWAEQIKTDLGLRKLAHETWDFLDNLAQAEA